MTTERKKMDKLLKGWKEEFGALEEKCKAGNATQDEYKQLTKLRKKMK